MWVYTRGAGVSCAKRRQCESPALGWVSRGLGMAGSSCHLGRVPIVCVPSWLSYKSLVVRTVYFLFPCPASLRPVIWEKETWMRHTLASWPACHSPAGAAASCPVLQPGSSCQQVLRPLLSPCTLPGRRDCRAHTAPATKWPTSFVGPETQNRRNGLKTGASMW